jgi:putative acetyltransferase
MIEIKKIQRHQVAEVEQVILSVCHEIWQLPLEVIRCYDAMSDLDDISLNYFESNGTFLVIIDNGAVVGSGAIRRVNDDICELKRLWLLKEYRGLGLGRKMTQILIDFAKFANYKIVRLDLVDQQKQSQAINLYKCFDFYFIERYNDSSANIFMEKIL